MLMRYDSLPGAIFRRFSRAESTTEGNDLRNCSMAFTSEAWAEMYGYVLAKVSPSLR